MNGIVDEDNRALIHVAIRANAEQPTKEVEAWIDTAFDGHFVFSGRIVQQLGLETLAETEAILADGSKVALQTYVCYLDWFGETIAAQVVENEGRFPLLGTGLLADRKLMIDYAKKTIELT